MRGEDINSDKLRITREILHFLSTLLASPSILNLVSFSLMVNIPDERNIFIFIQFIRFTGLPCSAFMHKLESSFIIQVALWQEVCKRGEGKWKEWKGKNVKWKLLMGAKRYDNDNVRWFFFLPPAVHCWMIHLNWRKRNDFSRIFCCRYRMMLMMIFDIQKSPSSCSSSTIGKRFICSAEIDHSREGQQEKISF